MQFNEVAYMNEICMLCHVSIFARLAFILQISVQSSCYFDRHKTECHSVDENFVVGFPSFSPKINKNEVS